MLSTYARFSSLLLALLLLPACLAQSPSARLSKLSKLASSSSDRVIRLNSALYEEFTSGASERDYALSVVLTALKAQFNCAQCRSVSHSLVGVLY